jgi:hypothetical protein
MDELLRLAETAAESGTKVSAVRANWNEVKADKRLKEDALYQKFPKLTEAQKDRVVSVYVSENHLPGELITLRVYEKERDDMWEKKLANIWKRNKQPKRVLDAALTTLAESAAEADSAARAAKTDLKRQKREARANERAIQNKYPQPTEQDRHLVLLAYANEQARQGKLFTLAEWEQKQADIWGARAVL